MTNPGALSFADLVAPLSPQAFLSDYVGKRIAHMPAQAGVDREVLTWERLNQLLGIASHWTDAHLKLVIQGMPVGKDRYCDPGQSIHGPVWRADPAKVRAFVGLGASIVANLVDEVSPELRQMCETIGDAMGGVATANIYSSFQNIGGFGPHFDASDVLAFQCSGEKVWRFYEGRADNPVSTLNGPEDVVLAQLRRNAGRQTDEIVMRPGDALYVPRGWYHDALTRSETSLHVTFSVLPLTARLLLRILDQVAMEDSLFREYLPDGRRDERAFRAHMDRLGTRLKEIATSPGVASEILRFQREMRKPFSDYDLPARPQVRAYRVVRKFEVTPGNPPMARVSGGGELSVQNAPDAAAWMSGLAAINNLEAYAKYRTVPREDIDQVIEGLVRAGAIIPL